MAFLRDHPVASATLAGASLVGGASFVHAFRDTPGDVEDRFDQAGMSGIQAALGTTALVGLGYYGFRNRGPVSAGMRGVGSFLQGQYTSTVNQVANDRYLLGALVPRDASHEATILSRGARPLTKAGVALNVYGRNGRLMMGAGGLAGLALGAMHGHPMMGLAVGAGAGLAIKGGIGAGAMWKKLSNIPFARTAAVIAGSTALFAGVQAATPATYESETFAVRDGSGGYDVSSESPLRARMDAMRASGNVVLGLNRLRHG